MQTLRRLHGHVGFGPEVLRVPLHRAVSQRHLHKELVPVLRLPDLADTFGHNKRRLGEHRVFHEEVLRRVGRPDAQREVVDLSVGPSHGGQQPVGHLERAAHAPAHAVAIGVVYGVTALPEARHEVVRICKIYEAVPRDVIKQGVVGQILPVAHLGLGICLPSLEVERHEVAIDAVLRAHDGVHPAQRLAVHLHREVADVGMNALRAEGDVVVVGRSGFEAHRHDFLRAAVVQFILHIHAGVSVVAQTDGEHLACEGDVGLLDGHQMVAVDAEHAVVAPRRQRRQRRNEKHA